MTDIIYKLVLVYSWGGQNLNLETDGKISLIATFMQSCVIQSKLSLSFTKALSFPHKKACFWNNSHNAYKNGDCNPKFNVTKLNPWKLTFWKQPVIAKDGIKVCYPSQKIWGQEFHHPDLFLQ